MDRRGFFKHLMIAGVLFPLFNNSLVQQFQSYDKVIGDWYFDEMNRILGGIKLRNYYTISICRASNSEIKFNPEERNHFGCSLRCFKEGFRISFIELILQKNPSPLIHIIDNEIQYNKGVIHQPKWFHDKSSIIYFPKNSDNVNLNEFFRNRFEQHFVTIKLKKYFVSKKKNLLLIYDAEIYSKGLTFNFPIRYAALSNKIL